MSQSRFSIVLVGVSALLRRPLVSRLRPAGFTARCSGGFCRSALPSVSEIAAGRVDLRAHGFRFSARTASGLPLGGLALPPSASEIAARRVGLRAHASVFRHAPLRGCRSAGWFFCLPLRGCPRRVGLRTHRFRFSARTASELPSAGWPSGSRLPLSARTASGLPLGGLAFGLTASAFRHVPLRGCRWAGWPSGSRLPLFGTHRFGVAAGRVGLRAHGFRFSARADPHRRTAEARTDGAQRHDTCFTSKHLSQHVNLPHRTP